MHYYSKYLPDGRLGARDTVAAWINPCRQMSYSVRGESMTKKMVIQR